MAQRFAFRVLPLLLCLVSAAAGAQPSPSPLPNPQHGPPIPEFKEASSRTAYVQWQETTQQRLKSYIPDEATRKEFVQTVWYESRRAGLDAALVLGVVDAMSSFRKFNVTENGAFGYMAVNPSWAQSIGDGDVSKLHHMQTNLRMGCVVLRHYLDQVHGDVPAALAKYVANNLALADNNPRVPATVNKILGARGNWVHIERPAK